MAGVLTVGRERELTGLSRLVGLLADGGGGAIALVGEPGIGKSHLLRSVAATASTCGIEVVSGRATDVGHTEPYRPLLEVISRALADHPAESPYADLARKMLGVGGGAAHAITPTALGEAQLHVCARRVVVFEDLHWADPDSLAAIEYVVDHAADAEIAVVLTTRDDGDKSVEMVRRAAARGSLDLFEIGPLDEEQCGRLAAELGGPTAGTSSRAIHRWSGGVPLIVSAVAGDPDALRAVVNGWPTAPATFADVVVGQLDRLSDRERYVMAAAALLGDRIDPTDVAAVADVDRAEVIATLRSAVEARLVDDGGSRFSHSLTRVVTLDQLLAVEREDLASRALATLTDLGPTVRSRLSAEAGDTDGAAALLFEAGVAAAGVGALANAEDLLRQSLAIDHSDAAHAELIDVLAAVGKPAEVIESTQHVADDDERRVRLLLARARALRSAGRVEDAERLLAKLGAGDSAESVEIALLAASIRLEAGDAEAAARLVAPIVDDECVTPLQRSEALCVAGRVHRQELRLDRAREAFTAAITAAAGSSSHLATARFELGTVDFAEIGPSDALEQASRDAVASGALGLAAYADHLRIAQAAERLELPEVDGEELLARVRRLGLGALDRPMVGLLALVRALHLDRTGVGRWARETARDGVRDQWTGMAHTSLGVAELLCENRQAALDSFVAAEDMYPPDSLVFPWRRLGAILALLEGREYDELPPGRPIDSAIESAIAAIRLGSCGDGEEATLEAERSFRRLERAPRFRALLQRFVAEAAIRHGFGHPDAWLADATPVLAASHLHAVTAAAEVLAADAERPGSDPSIPPDLEARGVTARELEVLEHLVEGRSYAEIGNRIHMSPRTVEGHVGRIRTKFDGISRVELIVIAAEALGRGRA